MSANDKVRANISAIIAEIEATQRAMGVVVHQPDDREAFDIVARIERRLLAQPLKAPAE